MPTIWTGVHQVIGADCVFQSAQNASIELIAEVVTNLRRLLDDCWASEALKLALPGGPTWCQTTQIQAEIIARQVRASLTSACPTDDSRLVA